MFTCFGARSFDIAPFFLHGIVSPASLDLTRTLPVPQLLGPLLLGSARIRHLVQCRVSSFCLAPPVFFMRFYVSGFLLRARPPREASHLCREHEHEPL